MKFLLFFLSLSSLLSANGIEDARTYHGNSSVQWRIAIEIIDSIPFMESEHILDVGSGDGKITALLAEKITKGSILGLDISQSMIDFATTHYPQINYPNLSFQKGNAAELFFENQFDRVVSFSTLHWVLDQENALTGIYRALVPGGIVCIQTYGKSPMNVTSVADTLVHTEKWAPYFPSYSKQRVFFTEQEYHALLEQAGFQQVSVIGCWDDTPFPDQQALIDFAKPLLNFTLHLSQDLQQEFVEDVADRIISIANPSIGEPIHYRTFSLRAQGYK